MAQMFFKVHRHADLSAFTWADLISSQTEGPLINQADDEGGDETVMGGGLMWKVY